MTVCMSITIFENLYKVNIQFFEDLYIIDSVSKSLIPFKISLSIQFDVRICDSPNLKSFIGFDVTLIAAIRARRNRRRFQSCIDN